MAKLPFAIGMQWAVLVTALAAGGPARAGEGDYRIGLALTDITGPPVGVTMAGYVRADQVSAGVHLRQFARAFVIAEPQGDRRVAVVVADLAFVSHTLKLAVLEAIERELPGRYRHDNLVLTATHTHCAPGGFHHYFALNPLLGSFHQQYFDELAAGLAAAVVEAEGRLAPGTIRFGQGLVEGGGVNRSAVAYDNNPADERARYAANVDRELTQLSFFAADGRALGVLNWFAVHPTSMNYYNRLISSDNKGYAAVEMERRRGQRYLSNDDPFVAGFAQTNDGDVTPNLNLDTTGPGASDSESTALIGQRQLDVAEHLLSVANGTAVQGPLDSRLDFVDLAHVQVAVEFAGVEGAHTWPAAYGYSFGGGSTEEGGGHPLLREGMTKNDSFIDNVVRGMMPGPQPSPELIEGHRPKPILLAAGIREPPLIEQILPLGLLRIGQVWLVVGPAEYSTMSGRRIREAVASAAQVAPAQVVIAGYSNEFVGYCTTFEEYQSQQYEGGHTLFGPWTEAAYRQEFVRLARALATGEPVTPAKTPADLRGAVRSVALEGPDETPPEGAAPGDVVSDANESYHPGDVVRVKFWTGRPTNDYHRGERYLAIEQFDAGTSTWQAVGTDADWATQIRWSQGPEPPSPAPPPRPAPRPAAGAPPKSNSLGAVTAYLPPGPTKIKPDASQVELTWEIPADTAGRFRLVHYGRFKSNGQIERFECRSREFVVGP